MRPIGSLLAGLLAALLLTACSQEPPPAREPAKPEVQIPQPASQPSQEMIEKADREMKDTVGTVKEEVQKEVSDVQKEAAAVTEEVKSTAAQATAEVKKDAAEVMGKVEAPATAGPESATVFRGPVTVTYEASMGQVTFDHAGHAGRLACGKCHPTDPPVKIDIDKELAHSLCKGCHKESGGNAPTACNGCHKK